MNSFYTQEELLQIGFAHVGDNVFCSRKASFYSPENISIGHDVRIDDFCILSGCVLLGNNIHISAYTALYGSSFGIVVDDFATISGRCMLYAESDDYSGEYMTNPMVIKAARRPYGGKIKIGRHTIVGAGCVILPSVSLNEGACVGAMSLVTRNLDAWTINVGIPCCFKKNRKKNALKIEHRFYGSHDSCNKV